jgi:hypothetical protein
VDGYYLPFKPCRPITYPDGQITTEKFSHITTTPLDLVLSFYDQRLKAQPVLEADVGEWRKEVLGDTKYLYVCYGVDINGLTTETGCIHVNKEEKGTHITTTLLRSEGGSMQCPRE